MWVFKAASFDAMALPRGVSRTQTGNGNNGAKRRQEVVDHRMYASEPDMRMPMPPAEGKFVRHAQVLRFIPITQTERPLHRDFIGVSSHSVGERYMKANKYVSWHRSWRDAPLFLALLANNA